MINEMRLSACGLKLKNCICYFLLNNLIMTETRSDEPQKAQMNILPSSITVSTFTAARIKEIQAMKKAITESTAVKMAFQRLPRHMRRRAMSHNVKRLPRRLREIHASQLKKSGLPPKIKRPSRKYRRRPHNLMSDYSRRKRRIKWLDTHIWHAKRFHMIEKWGFKLPHRPCDKSFKACYRATTSNCLLQDMSYFQCIELSGSFQKLIEKLTKLTDSTIGLTFGAKCYSEGKKFGEVTVFHPKTDQDKFHKPIGQVEFFWKTKTDSEIRKLWIFVHPSFYREFQSVLLDLFDLQSVSMELKDGSDELTPTFQNSHGVVLKELQYHLGKFRLTGPLATAVLKNSFKLVEFIDKPANLPNWLETSHFTQMAEQNTTFKNIYDTSHLPPYLVLSILAYDPRFNFPKKRTKSSSLTPVQTDVDSFVNLQKNMSHSPLWNEKVRDCVKENKISNAKICEMRSQLLVPGTDVEEKGEIVPIILLWRPGNKGAKNNGYSSGWDVIVPSSYSQSCFLSFVMWGARAGGLRETQSIAFERSRSDILYPDTMAGEAEERDISEEVKERFFRLPPNKRTNFNKFGIVSPVSFNWRILMNDWCGSATDCDNFRVVRDRILLTSIQAFLTNKTKNALLPTLPDNCLVPVQITPVKKGLCSRFAIICRPKQADLKNQPVEPKCKDLFAEKRNDMRKSHKLLLKRLRKRRKRAKGTNKPILKTSKTFLENYKTEMRKLWLPEPKTIKSSCSRDIMGFVKHGDFSFTLGQSKGLGYIVGSSLKSLSTLSSRNKILFRNCNSRNYKLAVIEVLFE